MYRMARCAVFITNFQNDKRMTSEIFLKMAKKCECDSYSVCKTLQGNNHLVLCSNDFFLYVNKFLNE